ncbi:MAG: hypothetical protein EXX96DRAFT_543905 [Benjaminiella poitrasii]|nr:MAG: hypothetical protein EXX96DRAFT_544070 [Benjaminiella poitrasii]KAI9468238.1 MAG: hypothetical protein EXX96DRAFT_543905 [Benjaminiella poitrasii]
MTSQLYCHKASENAHVLNITLSSRPGAYISSKLFFREDEIVNIVINAATDGHGNGSLYCISSNEFSVGRKSDKPTETALLILVEFQQIVDISFMKRINRYRLNVHDAYKIFPKVITIEEDCPYFTTCE